MPQYKYKVRDKYGKLVSGTTTGDNKDAVAAHFNSMGYTLISIQEQAGAAEQISFFGRKNRVKPQDLNIFNRQLVTLIKAGLPLLTGLIAIEKQTTSEALKNVIKAIIKDIEGGSNFSDALMRHPHVFDELYVNTIKAAETSGALDEIMERLSDLGEHEFATKTKIKAATRYPIIAISTLVIGFSILVTFVIPKFASLFKRFGSNLPLPTKFMIWLASFVRGYWYVIILIVVAAIFIFKKVNATERGRLFFDNFKLKVPIFGNLIFMLTMSRFCRIMAIMLRSGVPILKILDMISNATGNVVISNAINDIKNSVNEGKSMAEPMAASGVFTPMVVQMVAIGEETGQIDKLLFRVSEYYDEQADYIIKNLTTMIEPILIVILGGIVLLLALSIFLPMWNMAKLFIKH